MEDSQREQEECESNFREVFTKLEAGTELLEEIRRNPRESSPELQDVSHLKSLLSELSSDYHQLVGMWEEKNKNLHLDVSLKSFEEDSKQVC